MPVSPNRPSSSVSSPHDILGSIEETPQIDGHKFRGRRRSNKKQKYPLTQTETNNPQPGLDTDNGKERQSSTRSPKYSRENYRLKSKRAKGKAREGTCPIDLAETKNRLAGSNQGFLSVKSGECQDLLQTIIARKSAWCTGSNKTGETLDAESSDEIPDESKSDPEDWEQVYTPEIKVDIATDGWNTVYNPAVFYGAIPPGQESEPESDSEDFDKVYNSEADMDTDQEESDR